MTDIAIVNVRERHTHFGALCHTVCGQETRLSLRTTVETPAPRRRTG